MPCRASPNERKRAAPSIDDGRIEGGIWPDLLSPPHHPDAAPEGGASVGQLPPTERHRQLLRDGQPAKPAGAPFLPSSARRLTATAVGREPIGRRLCAAICLQLPDDDHLHVVVHGVLPSS